MPNTTRKGQHGDIKENQSDTKRGQGAGAKDRGYDDAGSEVQHGKKSADSQHGNSSGNKKK